MSSDFGDKEKVVRINSLVTDYGKSDIAVVTKGRPDALLVPKVNWPEDVVAYDALIAKAEKNEDLPPGGIGLMAMIETPLGVVDIDPIASVCPRMRGLLKGKYPNSKKGESYEIANHICQGSQNDHRTLHDGQGRR